MRAVSSPAASGRRLVPAEQALTALTRKRFLDHLRYAGIYLLVGCGAALVMVPLLWMLASSLQTNVQASSFPPTWWPRPFAWENYPQALTVLPFGRYFLNSFEIATGSSLGALFSASLVGFAFARLHAPERNALFIVLLATMMLPGQVTLIPVYIIFRDLGWINTYKPLIVPSFFGSAFFIFLMRQFFATIPVELEDAAKIDGCGYFQMFLRIFLPLAKPALAAVVVFNFTESWTNFLGPLIYLNDAIKYPVSVGLEYFQTSQYSAGHMNWLMAVSLLSIIPVATLFFVAQKTFVRGIIMTGLKG